MGRPKGSKNKGSLVKREIKELPKSLPKVEEPCTTLGTGAEIPKVVYAPILGMCKACNHNPANSSTDSLCLNCHNDKLGLVFDESTKRFKKENKHGKMGRL